MAGQPSVWWTSVASSDGRSLIPLSCRISWWASALSKASRGALISLSEPDSRRRDRGSAGAERLIRIR
ncbi:hypothetical protein [Actinocorallia longicatena]|uniref:hypothetical protein n=1 Tax=Actinocorallia longicatena TaxID=111803 RepID=UPI0031E31636